MENNEVLHPTTNEEVPAAAPSARPHTEADVKLLAKCGWLEGRNAGPISMAAVMHVVLNRIASPDFPKTVSAVINQPNQFSWTRPDNPEYGLDPTTTTGVDLEMWYKALLLAEDVLDGRSADFTGGACYYEAPSATSGWFKRVIAGPDLMGTLEHRFTVEIGGQRYYK
jgi:N-acetylmuramoyl-L-alanine amidase